MPAGIARLNSFDRPVIRRAYSRAIGALRFDPAQFDPAQFDLTRFDPNPMTFAECIRLRRTELNLTQAAAAALLSVSRRTIQHWEDPRRPAPHVLTQEGALARLDAEQPRRKVDAVGAPASSV